jgi:formylmethanofuran dehydrogenase subunit B
MAQRFTDVPCTVCGCVCDDLTLDIENGQVTRADRACNLATAWFDAFNNAPPPVTTLNGRDASYSDALGAAADILRQSKAPLIYGLSRSSTPGQRAAVELAEQLGATIDTTASVCHGPSIVAIQQVGESTCTLGEVRHRADLVIFWGADPVQSHPRHFERYSVDPPGDFLPNGRADRTVVVIDSQRTETADRADYFYQVADGRDFEMIWALRLLLQGKPLDHDPGCGVPIEQLQQLADRMKSCRYGSVFFGMRLAQSDLGHATVAGLLQLVTELNAHTRFTARRLRIPGDVSGADSVLCWQTGFPFAVNFSRGYPRYSPNEYAADDLLARGEVDACLLVGGETVPTFSPAAGNHLSRIPTILLDYPHARPAFAPTIRFTTAVYGLHAAGTIYRMDEIPLPLRKLCDTYLPTDEQILRNLLAALRG